MSDTNHHVLTGKVDITSNLLVGSSHLFVDTNNNRVGLVTTDPDAGLHVNSNAYVNTDLRVGSGIVINDSANPGRITATEFEGDGSRLSNVPSGPAGAAATINAGTTTTGAAGSSASVTNSGTTSAAVFDFTIPRGDQGIQGIQGIQGVQGNQGVQGPSGTITIGTVTTVTNSSGASVTNSGTSENAIFNFNIPEGPTGQPGTNGTNGTNGADGTNYFTLSGSDIYRNTGNVGIGTASMACRLDIAGEDVMIRGNTPSLNFSEGTNGMDGAFRIHYDGTNQSDNNNFLAIQHKVNGSFTGTSLHCTLGGLVGVGTNDPGRPLDVQFTGDSGLRVKNTGTSHSSVYIDSASGYSYLRFESGGAAKFWLQSTPTGDLAFRPSGGSHVMDIKNNGNVGIGVTNPGYKLDVSGDINASGKINIGDWAAGQGYMASRTLTLGSTGSNYGGGNNWSGNTAALLFECADNTEIAVHDSGNRLASLMYFEGGSTNRINIGRNMGWGTTPLYAASTIYCVDSLTVWTTNGNSGTGYGINMISNVNHRYTWAPGNDNWLRLYGSGQSGNTYGSYRAVAVGPFWAAGATRFSSDDRIKHFEEEIPNCLELINQLKPYKYKKTSKIYTEDYTGEIGEEGKDWDWEIGLIAQDIKKIPYLEFSVADPETGPEGKYGLNYTNFIGVCIQGIKDLNKELQSEKKKSATLELLVASLLSRVGDLEKRIA